jgi:hypothetical protein
VLGGRRTADGDCNKKVGSIAFSPLAGGQLTDRYLNGIPADSRAASGSRFLNPIRLRMKSWQKSANLTIWRLGVGKNYRKWRWPGFCAGIR